MSSGHADTYVPERGPDGLRHWKVAGGVVRDSVGNVLLVENRRRDGALDWSTPGGVVDLGEASKQALSREVIEETGLEVDSWIGPLYRIEVTAPGFEFFLEVEAFLSAGYRGEIRIEDPDQIVVDSRFVSDAEAQDLLASAPQWVAEPLLDHLQNGVADGRLYAYLLEGTSKADRRVHRTA